MLKGQVFQRPLAVTCELDGKIRLPGQQGGFVWASAANGKRLVDEDGLRQGETSGRHFDGVSGLSAGNRLFECEIILPDLPDAPVYCPPRGCPPVCRVPALLAEIRDAASLIFLAGVAFQGRLRLAVHPMPCNPLLRQVLLRAVPPALSKYAMPFPYSPRRCCLPGSAAPGHLTSMPCNPLLRQTQLLTTPRADPSTIYHYRHACLSK
jgi:hypothetical protein